jgi:hypothetical protein
MQRRCEPLARSRPPTLAEPGGASATLAFARLLRDEAPEHLDENARQAFRTRQNRIRARSKQVGRIRGRLAIHREAEDVNPLHPGFGNDLTHVLYAGPTFVAIDVVGLAVRKE